MLQICTKYARLEQLLPFVSLFETFTSIDPSAVILYRPLSDKIKKKLVVKD